MDSPRSPRWTESGTPSPAGPRWIASRVSTTYSPASCTTNGTTHASSSLTICSRWRRRTLPSQCREYRQRKITCWIPDSERTTSAFGSS